MLLCTLCIAWLFFNIYFFLLSIVSICFVVLSIQHLVQISVSHSLARLLYSCSMDMFVCAQQKSAKKLKEEEDDADDDEKKIIDEKL